MAEPTSQKSSLCKLWGHDDTSIIDEKLSALRRVLGDLSQPILLDYLSKCDLDVERCIDLHFATGTSSPSPSRKNTTPIPPSPSTSISPSAPLLKFLPNHNSNADQAQPPKEATPSINDDNKASDDMDVDDVGNHEENMSSNDKNDDNADSDSNDQSESVTLRRSTRLSSKRRTKIKKVNTENESDTVDEEEESESSAFDPSETQQNSIFRRGKRSRKRSSRSSTTPRAKRRKLSSVNLDPSTPSISSSPSETTNSSSSKQERDDESDATHDEDIDLNEKQPEQSQMGNLPPIPTTDWRNLQFGAFSFRFRVKHKCSIMALSQLNYLQNSGKVEYVVDSDDHDWFDGDSDELVTLFRGAMNQMSRLGEYDRIKVLKTTCIVEKKATKKRRAAASSRQSRRYQLLFGLSSTDEDEEEVDKNEKKDSLPFEGLPFQHVTKALYETNFSVYIEKPPITAVQNMLWSELMKANAMHTFDIPEGFGACLAILGENEAVYKDYTDTSELVQSYEQKQDGNSRLTLAGILDFSCKYEHDITQNMIEEQTKYHVNVKLHEYQLQSIEYMINEENDPLGFYRHFYKLGRFDKHENAAFFYYYSSVFKQIIVNQHLPVVHGGFLCEEMGLGKTIECIALIHCNKRNDGECSTSKKLVRAEKQANEVGTVWNAQQLKEQEVIHYKSTATLVIAPVSLVGQWEKECVDKSTRKLKLKRYYNSSRKRDVKLYIDQDIVFTTYGILGKENGTDRSKHILHMIEWHRIILDESHYIKNGAACTSRNINCLRGVNKWLLSGTPFGRQVSDIANQLRFLGMKTEHISALRLASLKRLLSRNGCANSDAVPLLKVMKHLVMRHKKAQKFNAKDIVEMTEKEEHVIYVEFEGQQKEYYDKLYATAKERYEVYKATGNIGRGSIALLASLLPARQACSGHIYSMEEIEQELNKAQAKTYRIQEMVNDVRNANKSAQELYEMALCEAFNLNDEECPICYETPFDDPLQTICRHIFCGECIKSILSENEKCPICRSKCSLRQLKKPPSKNTDGETPTTEDDGETETKKESETDDQDDDEKETKTETEKEEKKNGDGGEDGKIKFDTKLNLLINKIKELKRERPDDKSLIFTSFSRSLDWICEELKKNKIEYRTLTGSMSMNKRKKALEQFESNRNVKVFVLTVRSGAVGITLTAANHVFMMEPPFNPALYRQAINRVYRLGQRKKVFCHTLIMKDSIEERIWNINKEKQKNHKAVAGNISMDKSGKLQQHEITKLFEPVEESNEEDEL